MRPVYLFAAAFFVLSGVAYCSDSDKMVRKGNAFYGMEKYDDALKEYDNALSKEPDSQLINFNRGAAQYKSGDMQGAISSFEKAAVSADAELEAKANYNLAGAKYKAAMAKKESSIEEATGLLGGALAGYKRAIELDPRDMDAKINYEITEKEYELLKEKLQQQKNSQQQDQEKRSSQKSEKNDSQGSGGEQQSGEQQGMKDKQENPEQQEQKDKGGSSGEKNGQEEQKAQDSGSAGKENSGSKDEGGYSSGKDAGHQGREMSEQEAKMLLDGYTQEENALGKIDDRRGGRETSVDKDW